MKYDMDMARNYSIGKEKGDKSCFKGRVVMSQEHLEKIRENEMSKDIESMLRSQLDKAKKSAEYHRQRYQSMMLEQSKVQKNIEKMEKDKKVLSDKVQSLSKRADAMQRILGLQFTVKGINPSSPFIWIKLKDANNNQLANLQSCLDKAFNKVGILVTDESVKSILECDDNELNSLGLQRVPKKNNTIKNGKKSKK